jgi:hypothetical protein
MNHRKDAMNSGWFGCLLSLLCLVVVVANGCLNQTNRVEVERLRGEVEHKQQMARDHANETGAAIEADLHRQLNR